MPYQTPLTPWQQCRRQLLQLCTPAPVDVQVVPGSPPISIVCIADTHMTQPEMTDGDVLVHAGDLTHSGELGELQSQLDWINSLPHKHKIVIGGNHDKLLDPCFGIKHPLCAAQGDIKDLHWGSIIYLCNSSTRIEIERRSLSIYGSPYTPEYGRWPFQYPPNEDVWHNTVLDGTDVFVCHGPPRGYLDNGVGCPHLLREIWRARPSLFVCGHIHVARGRTALNYEDPVAEARDAAAFGDVPGLWAVLCLVFAQLCFWRTVSGSGNRTMLVNAASTRDGPHKDPRDCYAVAYL